MRGVKQIWFETNIIVLRNSGSDIRVVGISFYFKYNRTKNKSKLNNGFITSRPIHYFLKFICGYNITETIRF